MKQAKRRLCLLLAAALLLSGCGAAGEQGEQTPDEAPVTAEELLGIPQVQETEKPQTDGVFALNYDPEASMNPLRASSAANMQFWSLLYDSVFALDENWNVESEIVETWNSDDYLWWVFTIYDGLCFSDGTPLTAADVVYSIQRAQQSSYYKARLNVIYGISAFDGITFAISTKYADSQLPALLNIPIIKKGDYFEDRPIGSGPYMLNASGDALVRNANNPRAGAMPIARIELRDYMDTSAKIAAFEQADIDIVTNDPTGMYNLGYGSVTETRYYDTSNLHYLGFNTRSMFFQSARVRYAVGYAIDRSYITEELMNGCGTPTTLAVHPKSALYDETLAQSYGYDPKKAAALFEAAGIDDLDHDEALEILVTGIIVELNIKFIVNNDSTVKLAAARRLTQELNDMGITTTLYELSFDDYVKALETGDYDMYYGEMRLTADWDLSALFDTASRYDAKTETFTGMNYAQTADESYAALYAAYLAAPESERYARFQEISRAIAESAIILPICFERREVLTHRGAVSGIRATQYDLFSHFDEWTIDVS